MIHIVNETGEEFKLAIIEGKGLGIIPSNFEGEPDENKAIKLLGIKSTKLVELVKERLNKSEGGYIIKAKRTSKFFVNDEGCVTMYERPIEEDYNYSAELISVPKGDDKTAYRHPKSIVVVITDYDESIGLEGENISTEDKSPIFAPEHDNVGACLEVNVAVIFCNYGKWKNLPDGDTYITLPCGDKLKFSYIEIEKNDRKMEVNALIRYHSDGSIVERTKKEFNKNNRGNNNHRNNNNNGGNRNKGRFNKRGNRSDILKGLDKIDN